MNNLYKRIDLDDTHYINIYYDEFSDSPRRWDPQTKLCVKPHREYNFPNELDIEFDDLENEDIYGTDKYWKDITVSDNEKKKFNGYHVYSIDCYIHSWVSFFLHGHGMQCSFDTASNCGYFCVRKYMGTREECAKVAREQISIYNQYLNGDTYFFKLMESFPPIEKDGKTYYTKDEEIECECTSEYYDLKEIAENIPQEYKEVFLKNI